MHLMQRPEPDDYVVATGQTHSVRDFCEAAFAVAGLEWEDFVVVDPPFTGPPRLTFWSGMPPALAGTRWGSQHRL